MKYPDKRLGRWAGELTSATSRQLASATLLVAATSVIPFLVTIGVARILGADQFGTYSFVLSLVGIFAALSALGLERVVLRDAGVYSLDRNGRTLIKHFMKRILGLCGLISTVAGLAIYLARSSIGGWLQVMPSAVGAGALALPFLTLLNLQHSLLRGLHRLHASQYSMNIVRPIALLFMLLLATGAGSQDAAADHVLLAYTLASAITLAVTSVMAWRALPRNLPHRDREAELKPWLTSGLHMLLLGLLGQLASLEVLLLGILSTQEEVGRYSAALRAASIIPMALGVGVVAAGPLFARFYSAGDKESMRRLNQAVIRHSLIVGAPICIALIVFGGRFLSLVFGSDFAQARAALAILCVGQFVNIAAGPVANLLTMTGHERDAAASMGLSAVISVSLSVVLIPSWGATGAAAAAAASLMLWNVLMAAFVHRRLDIRAPLLDALSPRTEAPSA